MRRRFPAHQGLMTLTACWLATGLSFVSACGSHEGALEPATGGTTNGGSSHAGHGESGMNTRGGSGGTAGALNPGGAAGAEGGNLAGLAGSGGDGGETTEPPRPLDCVFHTEAPTDIRNTTPEPSGGAGGQGGAAGAGGGGDLLLAGAGGQGGSAPLPDVTVQKSGFVGTYLADSSGKALYVYGGDLPGDCEQEPVSTCFNDCALSWPIFDAGLRELAEGLDDALFGTIERSDGLRQTTYRGWPLYYYKNDVGAGDVKGQAVGRIWHLAETVLPNLVILRVDTVRFLANEFGRTLYTFADDTPGTPESDPNSACIGDCLDDFTPFSLRYLSPVSYLEPSDFAVFVRADGRPQLAYKGAPLYFSNMDERAGDMKGTDVTGWVMAAP